MASRGEAHVSRKAEIVRVAASLFASQGASRVSMSEIAEVAGIAKPTLYHYFSTRDEIIVAIHEDSYAIMFGKAQARTAANCSPEEHIQGVILDTFELVDSRPGYSRVIFEQIRYLAPDYRRKVRDNQKNYQRYVEDVLERGISSGAFKDTDVHVAGLALFGMINWAHQWYSPDGRYTPTQLARRYFDLFVRGIGSADSGA